MEPKAGSRGVKRLAALRAADTIVAAITPGLEPGDLVAVMSNGGFDNIHDRLLAALAPTPGSSS